MCCHYYWILFVTSIAGITGQTKTEQMLMEEYRIWFWRLTEKRKQVLIWNFYFLIFHTTTLKNAVSSFVHLTMPILFGFGILLTSCLVIIIIYAMLISQIIPSVHNIISSADTYITNLSNYLYGVLRENPTIEEVAYSILEQYSAEVRYHKRRQYGK